MFFRAIPLAFAAFAAVKAAIHDVDVSDASGSLTYTPEALSAAVGDQVVFHFHPKNHTVTQSSFASPCGPKEGGFNSGFMPVAANQTDNFPTFTVTVNDTQPIWVYCAQGANTAVSHCGAGMVFAINCPDDSSPNSLSNFKKAALAIGANLKASASAASAAAAYSTPPPAAYTPAPTDSVSWTTGAGGYSYPAEPSVTTVTVTVTVASETWTSTYGSYPGSADPTPVSLSGAVHKVIVGSSNGTLAYDPPYVMAQPRDTIQFEFHQKNHTVSQSTFGSPCVPSLDSNGNPTLDSGFMPVAANATEFPTWNLTVNDTTPMWFFCRQTGHCAQGMVFAVNPVQESARNYTAFQQLAITVNGTNATGSATAPTNSTPSTPASQDSGAGSVAVNAALGLASVLAVFALAF